MSSKQRMWLLWAWILAYCACLPLHADEPLFSPEKLRAHVAYLASDQLHGRATGSPDERAAAEYIAEQLAAYGIQPPPDGQRFQDFVFGNKENPIRGANVLGWLDGSDPKLREQVIVIGAHYDHVGVKNGQVHPGADDNASGVSLLLEVARAAAAKRDQCPRSLVFAFFSGEEIGLLGSRSFIADCPLDINRIVAMVNIDMIGRPFMDQAKLAGWKRLVPWKAEKTVAVLGLSGRPLFAKVVNEACAKADIVPIGSQNIPLVFRFGDQMAKNRSDHTPFEGAGIPTVFFCSGQADDYHRPSDTADKIDGQLLAGRARAVFETLWLLSAAPSEEFPPTYNVKLPAAPAESSLILSSGDLRLELKDNSQSPAHLSGIDSLFNTKDAPTFDAFDPDSAGASAGLNFEHIIAGHKSPLNQFAPRQGTYRLFSIEPGRSGLLIRRREDCPWDVASSLRYEISPPHCVDFDFRCTFYDPARFGEHGHATFFFANYMNDVESPQIHFRGVEHAGDMEQWIAADAPGGHPHWNKGGSYRAIDAPQLPYDEHDFVLNSWSYDDPRFVHPFYYGRAAQGMVLILMFDRAYTKDDEIRFSLFKFKLPERMRPAWDFQYVVHPVHANREYGFRGRMVWKKWISAEDCLEEYKSWSARLKADGARTEAPITNQK